MHFPVSFVRRFLCLLFHCHFSQHLPATVGGRITDVEGIAGNPALVYVLL
jgi:hypothetical protein